MADAEMAANLTIYMSQLLRDRYGVPEVSHALLRTLQKVPAAKIMQTLGTLTQ
jgi:DNA polymerase-3 subunit epsilon